MTSRRMRVALAISLLLHVALLLWLRQAPVRAAEPQSHADSSPIEIDVREWAPKPAPVPEQTPPPAPVRAPAPSRAARAEAPKAVAPAQAAAPASSVEPPRQASLLPRDAVVAIPYAVEGDGPKGHTLHNDPSELPSEDMLLAQREQQGRARVQGMALDGLAGARAQNGLVDPYFHALRHELQAGLVHPPEIFRANQSATKRFRDWALQLKDSSSGAWERYGQTGSGYADPDGFMPELDVPTKTAEAAANGDVHSMQAASISYRGHRLLEFANGKAGIDLNAVVELFQAPDGELRSAVLLEPSGVLPFDDWVLRMAELSVDALAVAPPDGGVGIHADGLHSVWQFKGRVSYLRSKKDFDVKQDAWYVMVMAPLGMVPGTFDETTGEATYVDLRYPHYEANVKLLRVY